jgi:hypothetical protein
MGEVLERRFAAMGARLSLAERPWHGSLRLDVRSDRRGEYFDVRFVGAGDAPDLEVVDVDVRDRHLLLFVRDGDEKSKFLCGHDERHWFVAAIPEDARGVTGVATAKAALQPEAVREAAARVRPKERFRRRNSAFLRQGEWFFVPAPDVSVGEWEILRNEPLARSGGTPHRLQFAYRTGGTLVYVNRRHPAGIDASRFAALPRRERTDGSWTRMLRAPELYAKGAVRHPDHATVVLATWHRVLMNTEQGARAMRHVAFLD